MRPSLQKLASHNLDSAIKVLDEELGEGFVSIRELSSYIHHPQKTALGFIHDGTVLAVITGEVFPTHEELVATVPADMRDAFRETLGLVEASPIGLIKSVAVLETARRKGLAHALVAALLVEQRSLGANHFSSIGWTDEEGCHIQTVFERNNFHSVCDIADFWLQDSLDLGYSCPTCGFLCNCVARIFSMDDRDNV